jgi:MFS family permease
MNMKHRKPRLLSPILLWFMGTAILANIAAQMVFPLESLYVQDLGANVEQVGLFFTIAAIAPILFQLFGGWLSDSIGRLQAIAIGSIGGALSYLFYLFAQSWLWLLPASVLTAMAIAFVAPSFQAFIAEESSEDTRGRVYGVTSTMFMVVNIVGPLVGGAVAQTLSFRAMYLIAGCLYASAAVIRVAMAYYASRQKKLAGQPPGKPSFAGFRTSLLAVFGLVTFHTTDIDF